MDDDLFIETIMRSIPSPEDEHEHQVTIGEMSSPNPGAGHKNQVFISEIFIPKFGDGHEHQVTISEMFETNMISIPHSGDEHEHIYPAFWRRSAPRKRDLAESLTALVIGILASLETATMMAERAPTLAFLDFP
ncbi:hypothetical protein M9H77_32434 [Catharanthus roseus]|uniref:Uncharacterized protein n=1 Tax=Catharanthus roseus TaxID=4058 RepID=A0ACC0A5L9_CATRO|nr:hypothetical protein M9H77_32434 [Catharanthus roseus]